LAAQKAPWHHRKYHPVACHFVEGMHILTQYFEIGTGLLLQAQTPTKPKMMVIYDPPVKYDLFAGLLMPAVPLVLLTNYN